MSLAPPAPTDPPRTSRSNQLALACLGLLLFALLTYRAYAPGFGARPTTRTTIAHRVDLNTAERAELLQVPGVGPGLADAILAYRHEHGRFATVDDLNAVRGVGDRTLEKLRPWVVAGERASDPVTVERLERKPVTQPPAPVVRGGKIRPGEAPIDVNTATQAELERLPGIGPVMAGRIIDARTAGRFRAPDDLRRVKGIGPKTLDSIRPFVTCGEPSSADRE